MMLGALEIVVVGWLPVETKWIFPKDRFVEWGPEDESFCRAAGFGHAVRIEKVLRIGRQLFVSPEVYAEIAGKRTDLPILRDPGFVKNNCFA